MIKCFVILRRWSNMLVAVQTCLVQCFFVVINSLVIMGCNHPLILTEKESAFFKAAHVVSINQTWESIEGKVLEIFQLKGDGWIFLQYFAADFPRDFVDKENFKQWMQCIYREGSDTTYCRNEEWVYLSNQWQLVSRKIRVTTD